MKKKNLISFIIFIILISLFSSFLYFYYFVRPSEKPKYSTNIEELYFSFTDYMKDEVNSHLQLLSCEPKEYYYDNSNLCFVCGKIHACFGFGWVYRSGKQKMNPKSPFFLSGEYSQEEELNFYSENIAKLLNCKCSEECICEDGIKASVENFKVVFTFPENINIKEKITEIAKRDNVLKCEFTDVNKETEEKEIKEVGMTGMNLVDIIFSCNNIKGIIKSNEVIFGIELVLKGNE